MEYWNETMQDDLHIISEIGYKIELQKLTVKKNNKEITTYHSDLIPKNLVATKYFKDEVNDISNIEEKLNEIQTKKEEFLEEYCSDDGILNGLSITHNKTIKGQRTEVTEELYDGSSMAKGKVTEFIKQNRNNDDFTSEISLLKDYLTLFDEESLLNKNLKMKNQELNEKIIAKYRDLSEDEVKTLVVEDKWLATLSERIEQLLIDLIKKLSQRVKEIAKRYEHTIDELEKEQEELKIKVKQHLKLMGF